MKYALATFVAIVLMAISIGAKAQDSKEELFDQLVVAILENDYEAFISNGTDEFTSAISTESFSGVVAQYEDLSVEGYSSEYLTDLVQGGYTVHVWKLTHSDRTDGILAKLALDGSKVAGFWLQ